MHTISVLVTNHAGVLSRVVGLFSRRGFNIESLAVGVTENPDFSRITITAPGDDYVIEQIIKQLSKLIDVIKIKHLNSAESVEREFALIKVKANSDVRSDIIQICDIFRAKISNVTHESMIIEITGTSDKLSAFEELLGKFGIIEIARTGLIALEKGDDRL